MDTKTKFATSLSLIPTTIALYIFDHSMLFSFLPTSESRFPYYSAFILIYTAGLIFIYMFNIYLLHSAAKTKMRDFNISFESDTLEDRIFGSCMQIFIYSFIAILITKWTSGNFIHFIGNSIIVGLTVNFILLLTYIYFSISIKNDNK